MMLRRFFRGKIRLMHFIHAFILAFFLVACGDDNGSSPALDDLSSSSTTVIQSGDSHEDSSNSKKSSSSSLRQSSANLSSSSKAVKSSSSSKTVKSSSSSKTVILSSSEGSSSRPANSSSSEYVSFDHSKTLAGEWRIGENRYKTFTDPRNGRSYYYIKIVGEDRIGDKDSVTIMAENLNIGEMVSGKKNQNDDDKIERYCYNNDTTYCDEFGGLYQWAEMMQLPSRCNTESCADLIQQNHQGICPDGWRLMTYKDFYIAWHAETNEDGVKGLRSTYGFSGSNATGLSFVGAGLRDSDAKFDLLNGAAFWFYPAEYEKKGAIMAQSSSISANNDYPPTQVNDLKVQGSSVRCVMVENQ